MRPSFIHQPAWLGNKTLTKLAQYKNARYKRAADDSSSNWGDYLPAIDRFTPISWPGEKIYSLVTGNEPDASSYWPTALSGALYGLGLGLLYALLTGDERYLEKALAGALLGTALLPSYRYLRENILGTSEGEGTRSGRGGGRGSSPLASISKLYESGRPIGEAWDVASTVIKRGLPPAAVLYPTIIRSSRADFLARELERQKLLHGDVKSTLEKLFTPSSTASGSATSSPPPSSSATPSPPPGPTPVSISTDELKQMHRALFGSDMPSSTDKAIKSFQRLGLKVTPDTSRPGHYNISAAEGAALENIMSRAAANRVSRLGSIGRYIRSHPIRTSGYSLAALALAFWPEILSYFGVDLSGGPESAKIK